MHGTGQGPRWEGAPFPARRDASGFHCPRSGVLQVACPSSILMQRVSICCECLVCVPHSHHPFSPYGCLIPSKLNVMETSSPTMFNKFFISYSLRLIANCVKNPAR